ncbi:pentatricopeptide repeat-containing protein At3g58590 [Diospyros lotus]|uniref:pentatricopeptide repeat-containing protein At3g58590-like n=1 Tax=Diospyros lotus TaxID=55363 RepID=UPI0022586A40|nr:pentatricopeptide repeat-containing protein At3g58590-like [Diospyros lotus]XP_052178939.1 pentatricopeptide repeat-containing protein At3g58590 [Diospyros lotus]
MRKAASGSVLPFKFHKIFSSSKLHLFSVPLYHFHSHVAVPLQPANGELNQQRLVQLLQEGSGSGIRSLEAVKSVHALSITMASVFRQPIFLNNNIITAYATSGDLLAARKLFDEMLQRNVVSYNAMIGAYARYGNAEEAWKLFSEMRACGFEASQHTFGGLLSCASLDLCQGLYLQALTIKSGLLYTDAFAGTSLLGLFGRHGFLDEAIKVFEEMPHKNLVTWNSMLSLFGHHGLAEESFFMLRELMRRDVALSEYSYVGVLLAFASDQDLDFAEQIHGVLIKNGLNCEVLVGNALISMYVKSCGPHAAEKMFGDVVVRDTVSWNTIIGAFAKNDRPDKALDLFLRMHGDEVWPNQATFVNVVNSCTSSHILMYGKFVHAKIIKYMFESDVFVGSALVDLYAKHDELEDAYHCFGDIEEKNVVSWNALIFGYSNKCCPSSVSLLREMIQSDCWPNEFTFSSALKSSFVIELQQLHSLITKMGYHQNEYVSCSLITSYAKNGLVSDALTLVPVSDTPFSVVPTNVIAGIYNRTGQYDRAQDLFSLLEEPDLISWNILIAACSRNGDYKEVFELFGHMQVASIYPDNYTYVSLLSVCTKLCNFALGSSLHGYIIKTHFERCDTFVYNVMIDMYGKCGSLEGSLKIFNEMTDRNIISWTAIISSLGLHGHAAKALQRFREMEVVGLRPDGMAFKAVLSACRHGGLVDAGKVLFMQMRTNWGIEPDMDHYIVMVDLLTRHGHLKEAEQLIASMPFLPNSLIWRSFLEGCNRKKHSAQTLALEHVHLESSV